MKKISTWRLVTRIAIRLNNMYGLNIKFRGYCPVEICREILSEHKEKLKSDELKFLREVMEKAGVFGKLGFLR